MLNLKRAAVTQQTILGMFDDSWFTHAQIFDDVLLVSNKATNCIVLDSGDGLILIDAIFPKRGMFDAIVSAIRDVGWDPDDIKKFIVTHGHFDHAGCGRWIKEAFHPDIYISKVDYDFWTYHPHFPDKPETFKDFDIENFIGDGDEITLGNKTVKVYSTPGHTPGGLSFLFPVTDLGVRHTAALWGGTNPPNSVGEVSTYFKSLDYFMKQTDLNKADVALSTHPTLDNGFERMEYANNRLEHMPNAYILGAEGLRQYYQVFRGMCYERLDQIDAAEQVRI
jgi:metallo-beta-lactamase class B